MPRLALALCAFWFLSLFVFRTVVQFRSTGSTGVKGFHGRIGSLPWIAGASATLGLLFAPVGPLGAVLDWPAGDLLVVNRPLHLLGAVCAVLGIVGALTAQLSMGDSWRVGVDEEETTALVTDGLFAWVRNPIFTFIILSLVGLVLIVPNLLALTAAAFTLLGIELQVRAVEEPYLARTHRDAYRKYSSRVGRFLPRTGLRPPTRGASGAGMFLLVAALLTAMASSQPAAAEMVRGQVTESGTRAPLPLVSVAQPKTTNRLQKRMSTASSKLRSTSAPFCDLNTPVGKRRRSASSPTCRLPLNSSRTTFRCFRTSTTPSPSS